MDYQPAEIHCIAQAVYAEAKSESFDGKRAVAHVILNRARKSGKSPCLIIRQPGQFVYRTGSGKLWEDSVRAAREAGVDPTRGAHYFKSVTSRVRWNHRLTTRIGGHMFYK